MIDVTGGLRAFHGGKVDGGWKAPAAATDGYYAVKGEGFRGGFSKFIALNQHSLLECGS